MALELIGKEAFPNLYIKNIIIDGKKLKVTVSFFDYLKADGQFMVYGPKMLNNPNINLNILVCKDLSDIDTILSTNNTDYSLYTFKKNLINFGKNTPQFTTDPLDVERILEKPLGQLKTKIQQTQGSVENVESYVEIEHDFDFVFFGQNILDMEKLTCYAFMSYDIWKEKNPQLLDTSVPTNNRLFHGPVAAESIILGGQVRDVTNFLTIDDVGYPGPVHVHENKFMEGSFHVDMPHKNISVVPAINKKMNVLQAHTMFPDKQPLFGNSSYFSIPTVAVGNKFIYGFFCFDVDKYFSEQRISRFISAVYDINKLKVLDYITLKINGDDVNITEILVNHENSNQLFYYFRKNFVDYVPTSFEFEHKITNPNELYKPFVQNMYSIFQTSRDFAQTILTQQQGHTIEISNPSAMLGFIKTYIALVTRVKDLTNQDLIFLKKNTLYSLYKPRVHRTVLSRFLSYVDTSIATFAQEMETIVNQPSSAKIESETIYIELQNYKNMVTYLSANRILDPYLLGQFISRTNNRSTGNAGIFENLEHLLLPSHIRANTTMSNQLKPIDYNDLGSVADILKTVTPNATQEQEGFTEEIPEEDLPLNTTEETSDPASQEELNEISSGPDDIPDELNEGI